MRLFRFFLFSLLVLEACGATAPESAIEDRKGDVAAARNAIIQGAYSEAVELLAEAVADSDPDGLMLQGVLHAAGAGVVYDTTLALDMWEQAALSGHRDAARLVHARTSNPFAREWWGQRITELPLASVTVPPNFLVEKRNRVFVDRDVALNWTLEESAKGNPVGLYNAYHFAQFGARSSASKARVRQLLERSAALDLPAALMELSSELKQSFEKPELLSMGFAKDLERAAALMKRAAYLNDASAQLLWAHWLASDKRQFRDKAAAVVFYRKSAIQGNAFAAYFLSQAYRDGKGVEQDEDLAEKYLEQAALGGMDTAVNIYGQRLFRGSGVVADQSRAIIMLERSLVCSLTPNSNALEVVAYAYTAGLGVDRNLEKAIFWCKWAIHEGSTYAENLLKQINSRISSSAGK